VPVWLNYPSNLANGHLPGLNCKCAIDGSGGGRPILFVLLQVHLREAGDKMSELSVGVILSKATLPIINLK
jgi:hypothetical protein